MIHAITADDILARPRFEDQARAVMAALGTRGALHLRATLLPARRLFDLARSLARVAEETGAVLVINDRVDVALAAPARAIQLTTRSMSIADARRVAPTLMVGASVHAVTEAVTAARAGADWCVAGHVHETASHPGEPPRGPDFIAEVAQAVFIPVVAIGGVLPAHIPALREAGAHGVAVIRGIWDQPHPERAASDYLSSYDAHA